MQTQAKLVLDLTGRETLHYLGKPWGRNLLFGDGDFSCSLAAGGMNRTIVIFLSDCMMMDALLVQGMYCGSAARKSTCNFAHLWFIFPLCLEIMLSC